MRTGIIIGLSENAERDMLRAKSHGFASCQLVSWNRAEQTDEMAERVRAASERTGLPISSFWCGYPGSTVWDFVEGPLTLGLVPVEYRYERQQALLHGVEFAHLAGIKNVATHAGFIPENASDPLYPGFIACMRPIVALCARYDMYFLFETGQETPTTLLRAMTDLGGKNVGVNLDTGNLILYGKGNPADAVDVFGDYVRDMHCKDGFYPTDPNSLGREVQLGEGRANIAEVLRRLLAHGYKGPATIEREIAGEGQDEGIIAAKELLDRIISEI